MVQAIKKKVHEYLETGRGGDDADLSNLNIAVFSHGEKYPWSKKLYLVTNRVKPICMVKTVFNQEYCFVLENEVEGIKRFSSLDSEFLYPRVLFTDNIDGNYVLAISVVDGATIAARHANRYLEKVYTFQKQIPIESHISVGDITPYVSETFTNTLHQFNNATDDRVALGPCHGDLTHDNVLVSLKLPHVIDFERYQSMGIWGSDFLHYLVRAHHIVNEQMLEDVLKGLDFIEEGDKKYFSSIYDLYIYIEYLYKNDNKAYWQFHSRFRS